VVAFHELGLYDKGNLTVPPIALWSKVFDWIYTAFQSVMPHPDAGARMAGHFHAAGLGSVGIQREFMIAAAMLIMAAKL
jgi:hypothetical protein